MYVAVHNGKHYVGGSTSGCDYLRDNSHIPYSFIGHLSAKSGVVYKIHSSFPCCGYSLMIMENITI